MARPSEIIGEQVALARHRRRWTQSDLAEAVQEHDPDSNLGRGAIAKIESGVRRVSIDEMLLLAAAVNVPPAMLLVPLGSDDVVEVTPRSQIHPGLALNWIIGDEALVASSRKVINRGDWWAGSAPLRLHRQFRKLLEATHDANRAILHAEHVGNPEGMSRAREDKYKALEELHRHLRTMQDAGVRPPAMTSDLLEEMDSLGFDVLGLPLWAIPTDEAGERSHQRAVGTEDLERWKIQRRASTGDL